MNPIIDRTLSGFEPGEIQTHRNMTLVPIMSSAKGAPEYLTMKESLEKGHLVVTEVSEGGAVPNLKVVNTGDMAVLLLDGEELAGAKQNRVLNTTILVKKKSEVVIPVSCTEHGRWSYASREFYESGHIMDSHLRMNINRSVNHSLACARGAMSNQGEVWDGIHKMATDAEASSETGAMKDVFEKRAEEMDAYLKAFTCLPAQRGLMIFIGGEAVGFDYLSLDRAFAGLFPKLVKSYAMEAWLAARKKKGAADRKDIVDIAKAKAFFDEAAACEEKIYDSAGLGKDYRYSGVRLVGSSLALDKAVIHMAFFRTTEEEKTGHMAGMNRRRSFRV